MHSNGRDDTDPNGIESEILLRILANIYTPGIVVVVYHVTIVAIGHGLFLAFGTRLHTAVSSII